MSALRLIVRCLMRLWAAPCTLVGLLVVLAARCRFLGSGGPGGFLLYEVREKSWLERFFQGGGVEGVVPGQVIALTIGEVVIVADEAVVVIPGLLAHEGRHVFQAFALGPLWPLAYGLLTAAIWAFGNGQPYLDNALERDAREAEKTP